MEYGDKRMLRNNNRITAKQRHSEANVADNVITDVEVVSLNKGSAVLGIKRFLNKKGKPLMKSE